MAKPIELPTDREELIALLKKETHERRVTAKWIYGIGGGGLAFVILAELFLAVTKSQRPDLASVAPVIFLFGAGIGVSNRHKAITQAVSQWRDPEVAPMLAETLNCQVKEVIEPVKEALRGTLPLVTQEHASLFDPPSRKQLLNLAKDAEDPDLAEVTLKALRRIGTPSDLSALQSISDRQIPKGTEEIKGRLSTEAKMTMSEIRLRTARAVIDERVGLAAEELERQQERVPDVLT